MKNKERTRAYPSLEAIDGQEIARLRVQLDLSQERFAEMFRMSVRTLRDAERGRRVREDYAQAIARGLRKRLEELFVIPQILRETLTLEPPPGKTALGSSSAFVSSHSDGAPASIPISRADVIHNIRFFKRADRIERTDLLDFIDEKFLDERPGNLIALVGLGGIGKTQTAVQYSYRAIDRQRFRLIWWIRATTPTELAQDLDQLKQQLGTPGTAELSQKLRAIGSSLLVFDDAAEPSELLPFIIHDPTVRILVTSRNPNWGEIGISKEMPLPDRKEVVAYICRATSSDDLKNAERLAPLVGDLPLALGQAAAYIQSARLTISDYVLLFESHQSAVLKRGSPLAEYGANVATAWQLSFERIRESSAAATLLEMLAFFDTSNVFKSVLDECPNELPEELRGPQFELVYADAISVLRRYSMIEIDRLSGIYIHPLVAAVTRDRLLPERRRRILEDTLSYFASAFITLLPSHTGDAVIARFFVPHVLAVCEWAEKDNVNIKLVARLLDHVALVYYHEECFVQGESPARKALHLYDQCSDVENDNAVLANIILAHILYNLGRFAEARRHYLKGIQLETSSKTPNRRELIAGAYRVAETYLEEKNISEALAGIKQIVEMEKDLHGEESQDFAGALEILGFVLEKSGDTSAAEQYRHRAKQIWQRVAKPGWCWWDQTIVASDKFKPIFDQQGKELAASVGLDLSKE
ncbi:MAG TPA: helix-turn-helix domain-containing protein [Candidatus Angelobacter sp.]|nr:helix-turn-helix domain-containing protein [Candidatus Angelobacter sp.]